MGSNNTGRRDSFDRNTSAFSPSIEYSRGKWPQSYGALGEYGMFRKKFIKIQIRAYLV